MHLTANDLTALRELEESLWKESARFDPAHMDSILADDFIEFGRSGSTYDRKAILAMERTVIDATIPLPNFKIRAISENVALVTYASHVGYEGGVKYAHRSSLWSRSRLGWQLRFHQGTPF